MITICAWCDKQIRETTDEPLTEISHGICPDCTGKAKAEANRITDLYAGIKKKKK
jgi:hypothetical protein